MQMDIPSHQLTIEEFSRMIPGSPPTEEQQRQFYVPECMTATPVSVKRSGRHLRTRKVKTVARKFDLHSEVTATVQSVLNAAGKAANKFHYLQIPRHEATARTNVAENTVNSGGIYFDTGACGTSTSTKSKRNKKKQAANQCATIGCHSWDRVVVPFKVNIAFPKQGSVTSLDVSGENGGKGKSSPSPSVPTPNHSTPNAGFVGSTATLPDDSAFRSNDASATSNSEKEDVFAHLVEDTFNIFKFQHRISSWAVYITYEQARLLYFDRAGAYVSPSFDWTKTESLLHTFVWKLAHMPEVDLGYDPSATPPTKEELVRLDHAKNDLPLHPAVRRLVEEEMGNGYPLYKLCVTSYPTQAEDAFPDEVPPADHPQSTPPSTGGRSANDSATWTDRYFIVGRPQFSAETLIGRCTRSYIAYDLRDNAFYHLKDLWRSRAPGRTRPEHLVYERLHKYNVEGIAPLICGGDVGGPLTWMTDVQNSLPAENRPVARVHYRIVTGKIGVPLTSFANFRELAIVMRGAIATHYLAWAEAKVLHRDISVSNILIDPETRLAILIDWDLSRLQCELERPATEPNHTGTWPFQSGLSLRYPYKPYRVADDVESFVHVFHYLVLRFHHTNKLAYLFNTIDIRYYHFQIIDGIKVGGKTKIEDFSMKKPRLQVKSNPKLQGLLDQLAIGCYKSYSHIDHKYMKRLYGTSEDQEDADSESDDENDEAAIDLPGEAEIPVSMEDQSDDDSPSSKDRSRSMQWEVEGFLTHHGALLKAFRMYSVNKADKEKDQFVWYTDGDRETPGTKTQDTSEMSETYTAYMERMSHVVARPDGIVLRSEKNSLFHRHAAAGGTSSARQVSLDRSTSGDSHPSAETSPGSSAIHSARRGQKRRREQEPESVGGVDVGDRVEEGNSNARPVKRRSTRITKAASKTHS